MRRSTSRRLSVTPFSTRKGWLQDRPLIRPSVRTGAPSPQGEGFGGWEGPFPSAKPPLPARPAGGRAVTGVGKWAAGQAKKEGGPPQGPPQLEKVGPGRKNLFLPGVLSPDFLQRKSGSPPESAGPPGALRPKVASEPPTPRVRTTVMPLVWLAGFEFRSLLTRLKDAGTFCVPWLHGNLSQRVYKRQFHKYHSFFLTILLLFATINMKILSLENVK